MVLFFFLFSFEGRQYKYVKKKNYSSLEGYFKTTSEGPPHIETHAHVVKLKKIKPRGLGDGIENDIVCRDYQELERGGGVFTGTITCLRNPRRDARKVSVLIKRN